MNSVTNRLPKGQFSRLANLAYPVHESVIAKPGQRNLPELITRFPGKGNGMKVFRKTWPEDSYWLIMHTHMTTARTARLYGLKYW